MSQFWKAGAATLAFAATATLFTPLSTPPQAEAAEGCSAVHIVSVKGTGGSSTKAPTTNPEGVEGDVVRAAQKAFPGKVSSYTVPYPSGAGAVYSVNPLMDNDTTYGYSRLKGSMKALEHIQEFKKKCPNTKLAFTGFSQGASVAGDITALVANGAVKGVGPDDILGSILVADPGRAGNSSYATPPKNDYWIPHPQQGKYQRNGEIANVGADAPDTVGWTGQRSLPFTGIEGRVISLCDIQDIACSSAIGGEHRQIADMSDKDIFPNEAYRKGPSMFSVFINRVDTLLPVVVDALAQMATSNDYQPILDNARATALKANMNPMEQGVVNNFFDEIDKLFKIFRQDSLYGSKVSDRQIVAHALKIVYPEAKKMIPNKEQVLPVLDPAVAAIVASAPALPSDVAGRTDGFMKHLGGFVEHHASYYSGSNKTDGVPSGEWAQSAMVDGIGNYLSGKTLQTEGTDSAEDRQLEVAEPDRADDGLHAMLRYLDEGESVLGEDNNSPVSGDDQSPSSSATKSSKTSKSKTSKSTTSTTPSATVAEVAGPSVNTGGEVEGDSFFQKVASVIFA